MAEEVLAVRCVTGLALALTLGLAAAFPARAAQDDARLDQLFIRLKEAPTPAGAQAVERRIWAIWTASGRHKIDALMRDGIHQMNAGALDAALETFDTVVDQAPHFAEGWNKRATVHYLKGNMAHSMRDIQRTLELEPRHFGALSGMGLIFLERGDEAAALEAFERVLEIHPRARGVRERVESLRARVQGTRI